MTTVTPSRSSAGNWKHRDFPPPVGIMASVLQPVATVWTISSCPGRNASNPKTSRRSVAALGMAILIVICLLLPSVFHTKIR